MEVKVIGVVKRGEHLPNIRLCDGCRQNGQPLSEVRLMGSHWYDLCDPCIEAARQAPEPTTAAAWSAWLEKRRAAFPTPGWQPSPPISDEKPHRLKPSKGKAVSDQKRCDRCEQRGASIYECSFTFAHGVVYFVDLCDACWEVCSMPCEARSSEWYEQVLFPNSTLVRR